MVLAPPRRSRAAPLRALVPLGGLCPFGLANPVPASPALRSAISIRHSARGSLDASVEVMPQRPFGLVGARRCRLPNEAGRMRSPPEAGGWAAGGLRSRPGASLSIGNRSGIGVTIRDSPGSAGRKPDAAALDPTMAGSNTMKAWEALRDEASGCTRCDLYKCGTQTVFGEGALDARIMFVGEQPGDQEDLAGRPFVGPAGQLFDKAIEEAGIDRKRTYVTNAVKHFKFVRRGKRRIHDKPNGGEIAACRWWLEQELALIRPPLTVALGATAARSLFGKVVTISALRGRGHALAEGGEAWVTVHPSFLLRVRDDREAHYQRFVEDLRRIGERAARA
ncbi:MAG: UdgX family uracil-DNA binding protein [Alphaproteobacteria bacterium]|nr:MAG: UdgX family uracil-DNA binding protein [Alphaproteobacteria bacterium]